MSSNSASSSGNRNSADGKSPTKSAQKTLGMACGANSRPSRSAFRNSPFSVLGSGSSFGNIFCGVSVFADGCDVPFLQISIYECLSSETCPRAPRIHVEAWRVLRKLTFKASVTHINCSNLPDSKIKNSRVLGCILLVLGETDIARDFPIFLSGIRFGGSRLYSAGSSLKRSVANQKNVVIRIDTDIPVTVCHSDNPRRTFEISSTNYPAREDGVKAGMFVKDAKIKCPQLVTVPYDFGAYETVSTQVAYQFYDVLHNHRNKVQAVSCGEAFLDVSDSEVGDPEFLASITRKEILNTTGCTASAGIPENMLMARLATKTAKPDGQCYIPPEKVDDYLY